MKRMMWLTVFILLGSYCNCQSLKKYTIGNSGCAVYSFCSLTFDEAYSEDSSKVYTGECENDNIHYGVVCVKLLNKINDLNVAEETVVSYLDFLKTTFSIKKAAGYGKGNHLGVNENTRGVVDYWEDDKKNNWKVKAWTDGKFIGVVYVYTAAELPETKANIFLNSFKFP